MSRGPVASFLLTGGLGAKAAARHGVDSFDDSVHSPADREYPAPAPRTSMRDLHDQAATRRRESSCAKRVIGERSIARFGSYQDSAMQTSFGTSHVGIGARNLAQTACRTRFSCYREINLQNTFDFDDVVIARPRFRDKPSNDSSPTLYFCLQAPISQRKAHVRGSASRQIDIIQKAWTGAPVRSIN